jgi:hypothetical protein
MGINHLNFNTMSKRTQEEIDRQIEGLKKMKDTLPEFSHFGDNNWEKIDAQISVLRGHSTPDDYYVDEGMDDYQDGDNDTYFEAEAALFWLNGENDEDLFSE